MTQAEVDLVGPGGILPRMGYIDMCAAPKGMVLRVHMNVVPRSTVNTNGETEN